jgi:hypothetical protein
MKFVEDGIKVYLRGPRKKLGLIAETIVSALTNPNGCGATFSSNEPLLDVEVEIEPPPRSSRRPRRSTRRTG